MSEEKEDDKGRILAQRRGKGGRSKKRHKKKKSEKSSTDSSSTGDDADVFTGKIKKRYNPDNILQDLYWGRVHRDIHIWFWPKVIHFTIT